jgi:hypothetical protein
MKHQLLNNKKEIIVNGEIFEADKNGFVDLPVETKNVDCQPYKEKPVDKTKDDK